MSGHHRKPKSLVDIDKFERDLTEVHRTILAYTDKVRTSSPQYWPIMNLAMKVTETMREVTGRDVPWARRTGGASDGHYRSKPEE